MGIGWGMGIWERENLTWVAISYEIYEMSVCRVS